MNSDFYPLPFAVKEVSKEVVVALVQVLVQTLLKMEYFEYTLIKNFWPPGHKWHLFLTQRCFFRRQLDFLVLSFEDIPFLSKKLLQL